MSEGRSSITRFVIIGLCIAFTVLGFNNTYADNSDVISKAKTVTCGSGRDCTYQMLSQSRSPFAQTFSFQVSLTEKGQQRAASTDVECKREYVLVGDYQCRVTSGGLPGVVSASP